jgi:hypothetical protein
MTPSRHSASQSPMHARRDVYAPAGSEHLDALFGTPDDTIDSWDLEEIDTDDFMQSFED